MHLQEPMQSFISVSILEMMEEHSLYEAWIFFCFSFCLYEWVNHCSIEILKADCLKESPILFCFHRKGTLCTFLPGMLPNCELKKDTHKIDDHEFNGFLHITQSEIEITSLLCRLSLVASLPTVHCIMTTLAHDGGSTLYYAMASQYQSFL